MRRNNIETSENDRKRVGGQSNWVALLSFGGIAIIIALITWRFELSTYGNLAAKSENIFSALSTIGLHAGLAIFLERSFVYLSHRRDWNYRSAIIASISLGWILWAYVWFIANRAPDLWLPILAFSGAFIGGLISTSINEKLWENNSPPSTRIQAEVYQQHLDIIGIPAPDRLSKRIFDIFLAIIGIIGSVPIWASATFLIWFEDPGPILFVKNSVGKGGRNFHQYKFRTMVQGAEIHTGPILSKEGDDRVLLVGRLLRKTALDELPQVINILKGEMSFVGPRPQRTVLVHEYLEKMPEYSDRHQVLPGISGLAQVAGDYYLTPRQKLRFDRVYINNLSLGFDLKLLLLAFMITFWFRWQKDWNGKLPRRLLKLGR